MALLTVCDFFGFKKKYSKRNIKFFLNLSTSNMSSKIIFYEETRKVHSITTKDIGDRPSSIG